MPELDELNNNYFCPGAKCQADPRGSEAVKLTLVLKPPAPACGCSLYCKLVLGYSDTALYTAYRLAVSLAWHVQLGAGFVMHVIMSLSLQLSRCLCGNYDACQFLCLTFSVSLFSVCLSLFLCLCLSLSLSVSLSLSAFVSVLCLSLCLCLGVSLCLALI